MHSRAIIHTFTHRIHTLKHACRSPVHVQEDVYMFTVQEKGRAEERNEGMEANLVGIRDVQENVEQRKISSLTQQRIILSLL